MVRKLQDSLIGMMLMVLPIASSASLVGGVQGQTPSRFEVFQEPLVAFNAPGSTQWHGIEAAADRYQQLGDAAQVEPLQEYLADNPDSPWRASLLLNMALAKEQAGYYSEAISLLEQARTAATVGDRHVERAVANRALGQLLSMHTRFGHQEEVKKLLEEVTNAPAAASISELVSQARSGLWQMETMPQEVLRCGIVALDAWLATTRGGNRHIPTLEEVKAGTNGTSLAQLQSIAVENGIAAQAVHRSPSSPIPIPSVMHLKVGHYATILSEEDGRYQVFDPAYDQTRWLSRDAIDAEASGSFLVADDALNTAAWEPMPTEVAAAVLGAGNTARSQPDQLTTDDVVECDDPCSESKGMPRYRVHSMLVSLNIIDTPVGYTPPVGPDMAMTLSYIQRAAYQPSTYTFSNFGSKWTFNWQSYVQDDPQRAGSQVRAYLPGGGSRAYSGYNSGSGTFASEQRTGAQLVRTSGSPITYERRMPDGRRYIYAEPDGNAYYPRRVFLTEVVDANGNGVTLHYDDQQRLVRLTDATGKDSHVHYEHAENPLLITGITDPFGRTATFGYDASGRLNSITDAVELTSTFAYDGTFINKMTTPYGETRFSHGESGSRRWLVITDPKGEKERIEYRHSASGIPFSESILPSGMNLFNRYINSRNTFYWDKEAMRRAPGNYTQARIRHWYHLRTNTSTTTGVQESVKAPLEHRVWFNYPGQRWAGAEGTFDKPSKIGRVLPDGSTQLIQKSYNAFGNLTRQVDPEGRELVYEYAPNQIDVLRIKRKTASGYDLLAEFAYNDQHQPLTFTNANSKTTHYTYNAAGQLTSITNPLGHETRYEYSDEGHLLQVIDPNDIVVASYTYDDVGRIQSYTDALNYTVEYRYDNLDRVVQTLYPDGTEEAVDWDRLDPKTYEDRYGQTTVFTHDAVRNLTDVINPSNHHNHFDYFANGLKSKTVDGEDNVTEFERDIQGRLIRTIRPDLEDSHRSYDSAGRLNRITDPLEGQTVYGYAHDNRLSSVTAPNRATTTYRYDPHTAELIERQSPDGGTTRYSYDKMGNLIAKVDGNGVTTSYQYDALNRLIRVDYEDGQSDEYIYDNTANGIGRLTEIRDPSGTTRFSYDRRGNVVTRAHTSLSGETLTTRYDYTESDQLSRITYPSGAVVDYEYDRDRVVGVTVNGKPLLNEVEYAAFGPVSGWTWGNGLTMERGFDNTGRVAAFSLPNELRQLDYDPLGNIKTITGTGIDQHFDYDALNRLTVAASDDFSLGYEYDANGNRLWEQVDGVERTFAYTPGSNRLERAGNFDHSLDDAGNLRSDGDHDYHYDARNRLVSVDDGETAVYNYNALGERMYKLSRQRYQLTADLNRDGEVTSDDLHVLKGYIRNGDSPAEADLTQDGVVDRKDTACVATSIENDEGRSKPPRCHVGEWIEAKAETRFVYEGPRLLGKYDVAGEVSQEIIWLGDRPVGLLEDGQLLYIHSNQVNAPSVISDGSGQIVWLWEPRPFGDTRAETDPDGDGRELSFNLRFPGQYYDHEISQHYNYYRNYDPSLGRYIQSDLIGLRGGLNTYGYAYQNPHYFIDPLGLTSIAACANPANAAACAAAGISNGQRTKTAGRSLWCIIFGSCMANEEADEDSCVIDDKIRDQLDDRGWTEEEIDELVKGEPNGTTSDNRRPKKTPDGKGRNDPASVYGDKDGYVVVNDRTREVVQVSDRTPGSGWIPDSRIEWK